MASGNKSIAALKLIFEELEETGITDEEIDAIEGENVQLREQKTTLIHKLLILSNNSTAKNLIVLLKEMLSQQQSLNRVQSEYKNDATTRTMARSSEMSREAAYWESCIEDIELLTMPHNDVQQITDDMNEKIAENSLKIDELEQNYAELSKHNQKDTKWVSELNSTLKGLEKEQMKLIEKLKTNLK